MQRISRLSKTERPLYRLFTYNIDHEAKQDKNVKTKGKVKENRRGVEFDIAGGFLGLWTILPEFSTLSSIAARSLYFRKSSDPARKTEFDNLLRAAFGAFRGSQLGFGRFFVLLGAAY